MNRVQRAVLGVSIAGILLGDAVMVVQALAARPQQAQHPQGTQTLRPQHPQTTPFIGYQPAPSDSGSAAPAAAASGNFQPFMAKGPQGFSGLGHGDWTSEEFAFAPAWTLRLETDNRSGQICALTRYTVAALYANGDRAPFESTTSTVSGREWRYTESSYIHVQVTAPDECGWFITVLPAAS